MIKISFSKFKNSVFCKILKILFFVTLIFTSSCSPQKRLARLLYHHPELMQEIEKPHPVILIDTVYFNADSAETTFSSDIIDKEKELADTVGSCHIIAKADTERSSATLSYNPKDDKLSLKVYSKRDSAVIIRTDTVMVPHKTYETSTKEVESKTPWYDHLLNSFGMISIILFILFLLGYAIKRYFNL